MFLGISIKKGVKALFSRNKKLASELIEDIDAIAQYTVDEESLNTIMGLFCRKWEEEKVISDKHTKEALKNAVSYFKNNWVKRADVRNWWQGANPCIRPVCKLRSIETTINILIIWNCWFDDNI